MNLIKRVQYHDGGLESTEIQKKMPGYISLLGSQKYPYGNIPSMSWRENSYIQIYVLKIDHSLQKKRYFVDSNVNG